MSLALNGLGKRAKAVKLAHDALWTFGQIESLHEYAYAAAAGRMAKIRLWTEVFFQEYLSQLARFLKIG
jgi:hypothetical protein